MIPLKKTALALLFCLTVAGLGANEKTAVWERIYRNSFSDEQRYAVMLNILELRDRAFIPMLQESLSQLLVRNLEKGTADEVRQKISLAKLIVKELGNLRASEAAEDVFTVFNEVKDPFLKGEAALTLGKIRAVDYMDFLVRELDVMNLQPNRLDPRPQEIVAYSLVQAFELMRNPKGYEPVFLASLGWYSPVSQVRSSAKSALKTISADPTESLKKILTVNPSLVIKLRALEAMEESAAPDDGKAELGRLGLDIGMTFNPKTMEDRTNLLNIRSQSMKLLLQARDRSPQSVQALRTLVNTARIQEPGTDENEVITAMAVLGINGSDEATKHLADILVYYNERQRNGTNREKDNRYIRQLITSLGSTKNPLAKTALLEMEFSGYTPATIRESKNALKEIP